MKDASHSILSSWVEFAVSLDFVDGIAKGAIWEPTAYSNMMTSNSFDPTWIINSNSKLFIGSDINNLNPVSCEIKDLKVRYEIDPATSQVGTLSLMVLSGLSRIYI